MPTQLTVDLHPLFRNDRAIADAVRAALFRAAREQVEVVEIICGKGAGVLRKRVVQRDVAGVGSAEDGRLAGKGRRLRSARGSVLPREGHR